MHWHMDSAAYMELWKSLQPDRQAGSGPFNVLQKDGHPAYYNVNAKGQSLMQGEARPECCYDAETNAHLVARGRIPKDLSVPFGAHSNSKA